MVDLPSYRKLAKHQPGWFASRLGISMQEETDCLMLLVQMGRLTVTDARYQSTAALAVDTRPDPDATRQLAAFWMRAGAEKALIVGSGRYAFNTFGVSLLELERLRELQSRYFRELRAIVSESTETEVVAVATFQLFALATEPHSSGESC
jgi:hypothetical protein